MSYYPYESRAHRTFIAKLAKQLGLQPTMLEQALNAHPGMLDDLLRVRTELRVLTHKITSAARVKRPPQVLKSAAPHQPVPFVPVTTRRRSLPASTKYRPILSGNTHDSQAPI